MPTLNFPVCLETQEHYRVIAKDRKVPVQNLYAAVLREALALDLVSTVACEPRKPRAKETKPRAPRKLKVAPAELTVTPAEVAPAC